MLDFLAPSAPVNVIANSTSSTSIEVTWVMPESPNGIIRGYVVTYNLTGVGGINESTVGPVTSIELTNLQKYTEYTVVVQAVTVERGNASVPMTARTDEDRKCM